MQTVTVFFASANQFVCAISDVQTFSTSYQVISLSFVFHRRELKIGMCVGRPE